MHLRRALLLFALVLGLTALAASIAPAPDDSPTTPAPAPPAPGSGSTVQMAFRVPVPGHKPPDRRVRTGAHVIVTVTANQAGQASIPALGLVDSITASAPAHFDLLAPAPGRYPVVFTSATGEATRAGLIVAR